MKQLFLAVSKLQIYLIGCNLAVILTKGFKMIWQLEQPVCDGGELRVAYNLGKLCICDIDPGR